MTASQNSKHKGSRPLKCIDVQSWRAPSKQELRSFIDSFGPRPTGPRRRRRPSVLAVRDHLSPVDFYCYLKARFGEPNGFQTHVLRNKDTSDNWIHWDFIIKAGDEDVYVMGTSREAHFRLSEHLTDEDWRDLILAIKADYGRVGKQKSAVLKSLERWVVFPNKFIQVANVCAHHHAELVENMGGFQVYKTHSPTTKKQSREYSKILEQLRKRSSKLYEHCLQLSLLMPVMAEAYINMVILILCKPEVRSNKRQFDAFIRSHIDTKLFDLSYKCKGFSRSIDHNSETFKNFKRVMDKRNDVIHGNCDPEREQIELVYFEDTRPLFTESGDHIGKFFEALERQYEPKTVIKDYEETHAFLSDILACLEPGLAERVRTIMEDPYPGYDIDRNKTGALFPHRFVVVAGQGVRYDDELAVTWSQASSLW